MKIRKWEKPIALGILIMLLPIWGYIIYISADPSTDWQRNYLPAVRDLIHGNSPYTGHSAYNPFWTYLLLTPLALLPPVCGNIAIGLLCMITLGWTGYRLGVKPIPLALLLFTPQAMFLSRNGGIDWLVALGFVLPPQIGLFFVLIKPQIGIAVALFWFVEAWRNGKLREVARVFAPVCAAYLIGYALFGMDAIWRGTEFIGSKYPWDATLFPVSIPVGLVLLYQALKNRDLRKSILASPFLAPYVAFYSWPVAVLGLAEDSWAMSLAILGMWVVSIINKQY